MPDKYIEVPELPTETTIECGDCLLDIEEAPYYLRVSDAAFVCVCCRDADRT